MPTRLLTRTNISSISKRMNARPTFIWDPSLVFYAPLWDETNGANFLSKDAYQHACSVTGALWTSKGRWFDGLDDGVLKAGVTVANSAEFTIELWVKWNTGTDIQVLYSECGDGGSVFAIRKDAETQKLAFEIFVAPTWYIARSSGAVLVAGTCQHIVARLSSTSGMDLLADLVSVATNANKLPGNQTIAQTAIGAEWDSVGGLQVSFNGIEGELKCYTRWLSLAELTRNRLTTKWRYGL